MATDDNLEKPEGKKVIRRARTSSAMKAFVAKATVLPATPVTKKGTVMVRSLHIRKDHTTKSEVVGGLVYGNEVTIYETFTDGDDVWARIGEEQWAAMIYNGETYIKVEE